MLLAKVNTGVDEEEMAVLVKSLQTRDEQVQTDFRRECEMFAKLSHPNITRLLGMCREAEPYYMILEYADKVSHSSPSMNQQYFSKMLSEVLPFKKARFAV